MAHVMYPLSRARCTTSRRRGHGSRASSDTSGEVVAATMACKLCSRKRTTCSRVTSGCWTQCRHTSSSKPNQPRSPSTTSAWEPIDAAVDAAAKSPTKPSKTSACARRRRLSTHQRNRPGSPGPGRDAPVAAGDRRQADLPPHDPRRCPHAAPSSPARETAQTATTSATTQRADPG